MGWTAGKREPDHKKLPQLQKLRQQGRIIPDQSLDFVSRGQLLKAVDLSAHTVFWFYPVVRDAAIRRPQGYSDASSQQTVRWGTGSRSPVHSVQVHPSESLK
jgi:hypothetical protein